MRNVLLILLALAFLVATLAGSAYIGLYYGERDREAQRVETIAQHYQAGLKALNDGSYERAIAEFQYVLQLDASHTLAEQGVAQARERLMVKPTPTSEAANSLAEQLLAQAKSAYQSEEWASAANTFTQLRRLDPDYHQDEVEDLLFDSLYNGGIAFLDQDNLEQGISYLDQAIALHPMEVDTETVSRRNMAARYLVALGYWGVDWETCIDELAALYNDDPYYRDVAERLFEAYVLYAEYYTEQGEMCPAERIYARALRMFGGGSETLSQRLAEVSQVCLVATPTPVSGMSPILTPQPIEGFTMGRLAYPVYNVNQGLYDLYALYPDGRILAVGASADQPWWERGTGRVVYRDRVSGGIGMVLPEEGVPLQLLPADGQAWPTLSPDSQRIAYATPAADGIWYVYVANTDSTGEPLQLAAGWAPAWGPNGVLAYTGCDADENCGIILDNPDDGQPGTRLTGSEQDTAVSWAPGGNLLTYMSNVSGNWDLFLLNPQGGVQQLTTDASAEGLPTWSPDGSRLAFVSDRDGNWAIYVMTLDGQDVRRIVDLGPSMPGWDNQRLSWGP
jgi:outer membrane protein assembly factor BamD (BamD/ComL family)